MLNLLFFSPRHQLRAVSCLSTLFTALTIVAAATIVCLTSSKPANQKCSLNFRLLTEKPVEYQYGPQSVAVGDFNNDTVLDLVIAQQKVNEITVYLGVGDGTFINRTDYFTGDDSSPKMAEVADFDHDSLLDIAVANFGSNSIGIFYGLGNGSFAKRTAFFTGSSRPIAILAADFDGDSLVDIATANYGTASVSIDYVLERFQFSVQYQMGEDSFPIALAAGDFNNDNHTDLTIANHGTDNIRILFGGSNRTFEQQLLVLIGLHSQPHSVAVGYFNADEFADIAVANFATQRIDIFLNSGKETFIYHTSYSTNPASPYVIGVGDFNGDHLYDIVAANNGVPNLALFLGSENGSFQNQTFVQTRASSSVAVAMGDFNRDKRLDMVVVNEDAGNIDIFLDHFEGFSNQIKYPVGSSPQGIAVNDFNNDTRLDVAFTEAGNSKMSVLLGQGNGSFTERAEYLTGNSPQCIIVADLNNDSRLDVLVTNLDSEDISVFLGYTEKRLVKRTTLWTAPRSRPKSSVIDDFNNDSLWDIATANSGTHNIGIFFGRGNLSFTDQLTLTFILFESVHNLEKKV